MSQKINEIKEKINLHNFKNTYIMFTGVMG